jgi:hypothetical protein
MYHSLSQAHISIVAIVVQGFGTMVSHVPFKNGAELKVSMPVAQGLITI